MTPEEFREYHPEFATAGDDLTAKKIAVATTMISGAESDWGDDYETALALTVAHLLWTSPYGAAMRLDGDSEAKASPYQSRLAELRRAKIVPFLVT